MVELRLVENGIPLDNFQSLRKTTKEERLNAREQRGLRNGNLRECRKCGVIKPLKKFIYHGPSGKGSIRIYHTCTACFNSWNPNIRIFKSNTIVKSKADYQEYLKSSHWWNKRKEYWSSDRPKLCYICEGRANQLHHVCYDRLGREFLTDLVAVCQQCHESIHNYHNQHRNISLWQATKAYRVKRMTARSKGQ